MSRFTIAQATLDDMDFILSLAKEEGWNPGLHDAVPFYSTDPCGFFIGKLDKERIGCISAVAYNDEFGFLGFYIIKAPYRGQGYGLQLWNHAIDYMGNRTVGLDGVIAQQENYKKSGFKFYYRNIRFEGVGRSSHQTTLIDLKKIPFQTLLQFDTPIFGTQRELFLKYWTSMPNALCLGKMDKERLVGYGVIRSCANGYKIGPLFACDIGVAKEIYFALSSKAANQPIFLDIPEINKKALQLAENENLQKVFETARMYKKEPPKQHLDKVFGVTSFELG